MNQLLKFVLILATVLSHLHAVAQNRFIPSEEDVKWAKQFSGISGPGMPVAGNGWGGWRSGADGVKYSGRNPRPEYDLNWEDIATGSAVEKGLVPPFKPALELHVRDAVVTLGGDGNYYMTGSTGDNIWAWAEGIELWKSPDLKSWEYMGLVWNIDKEAEQWVKDWRQHPRRAVRAVWAPEIHYVKNNYFIVFSMCPNGMGILKSSTGKPEGPYVNAFHTEGPITDGGIDPTLFEDEDGKIYFTYGGATRIALLKDDMSGFDGPFRNIVFDDPDHNPDHHSAKCEPRGMNDLGHEGAVLFKRNGIYYLGAADEYEGRYSTCLAMSEHIYGPYRVRHEGVPCGGGTGFFKDKEGNWWCSYFGNDSQSHFREKVGFVRADFAEDKRVFVAKEQPFVDEKDKAEWEAKWEKVWKFNVNEAFIPKGNIVTSNVRVHDPVMIREKDTYYIFATGRGVSALKSKNMKEWERMTSPLTSLPWHKADIPEQDGSFWAPDIHYRDGKYHLYYSVSAWMNFNSSIGYATNTTLDPADPAYKWEDHGKVIDFRNGGEGVNCIDPHVFVDTDGKVWLFYGSYRAGLRLAELNPKTGKLFDETNPNITTLTTSLGEGVFLLKSTDEYYYIFASRGRCCAGLESTYQVVMGRSRNINGPYLSKTGDSWVNNRYSLLMSGDYDEPGRGHNGFFTENNITYIVYHAYNREADGTSLLRISPLYVDENGWPTVQNTGNFFKIKQ